MDIVDILTTSNNITHYKIEDNYLYIYGKISSINDENLLYKRGSDDNYEYIIIGSHEKISDSIRFPIKKIKLLLPNEAEYVMHLPNRKISTYLLSPNDMSFVGKGVYGSVTKSGKYAIKTFFPKTTDVPYLEATLLREVSTLIRLKHINIINIIDVVKGSPTNPDSDEASIIFPLANYNLFEYLEKKLSNDYIDITLQILKGMEYLHSKDIVHGDIKMDNILVFINNNYTIIKISDLGLSIPTGCEASSLQNNGYMLYYRPLEIMFAFGYGISADIWALGCLIYTIFTSRYLFYDSNDDLLKNQETLKINIVRNIFQTLGDPIDEYKLLDEYLFKNNIDTSKSTKRLKPFNLVNNTDIENIISLMLQYNPNKRIKISEILNKNVFKNLNHENNLDQGCPGILYEREKYQTINILENYKNIRTKLCKRLYEVIIINVKQKHFLTVLDFFPIMYIFDYSINIKVNISEDNIKYFLAACSEIWYSYKYGGSIFGNKKYSEMSPNTLSYFKIVNSYIPMILAIMDFDIIATTLADYITPKKPSHIDPLFLTAVEDEIVMNHLPSNIYKSIENYIQNPEYINIINKIIKK